MKWAIGITLVFLTGFFIGRSTLVPPTSSEAPSEEVSQLKNRISELEKEHETEKKEEVPTSPLQMKKESSTEISPYQQQERVEPTPSSVPEKPATKKWQAAEKAIPQIRTAQEVSAFLERAKIDNFAAESSKFHPVTQNDEVVELLNGQFVGLMTSQSNVPNFNITMDARINVRNQALRGRFSIRLSRGNKTFSRTSNNGEVQNIQKFGSDSMAIVIYSGDFYFHLYYFPLLESFEGNCYQQDKPGSMKYVGTLHLDRV